MNEQAIKKYFPNEKIIWQEIKNDALSYGQAFKQQNIKGMLFWVWLIILCIGIGASNFLGGFDFFIFAVFILLGAFHFHEKTKKAIQETSVVYGITNLSIFKINTYPEEKKVSYPIEQLIDIREEATNGKRNITFILEAATEDFSKNDIKGIVIFKDVNLPDEIINNLIQE